MNEEQIAEQQRQNIEADSQAEGPSVDAPAQDPVEFGLTLNTYRAMDHFEISPGDRNNQSIIDQINFVLRYASEQTQNGDLLDAMNYIRQMESRLGLRFKGNRLNNLYHWIRLDQEARRIEAEKLNHVA